MQRLWQTIRSYILWTYDRGSVHYDVMVTLILLFIFVTPRWVFKDKPVDRNPHQTEVVVTPDGKSGGFYYEIEASAVKGTGETAIRDSLLQVIEPIAGEVDIQSYETVRDPKGRIVAYRVRVQR